jgi:pimeloyl-ACP methyl ester carboxylesterase
MARFEYVRRLVGRSCGDRTACSYHGDRRNGSNEIPSWSNEHCARARRMGRRLKLVESNQTPTALDALSAPVSTAAWRTKPCWFVIAAHDRVVAPALQAIEAQQMNATSITLSSGHVAMLSQPYVVASFIRRAARDVR